VWARGTGLALALLAAEPSSITGQAWAQGTIVYYQPAAPLYPLFGQELDLNGDGQGECRFYSSGWQGFYYNTSASGVGTAQLLVTPQGPRDSGSYLLGWNPGFLIGGPTSERVFWAAHDAPNGYGGAYVLGVWLPDWIGSFIPDGDFYGTTAFMGIHFQIGSDWHYGWVRIRGEGAEAFLWPQGWILDWAYETRPNTPILAGAGIDADRAGVWDYLDQCPGTPAGTVVDANGCSIEQLCPRDGRWKNHGEYVSQVQAVATRFVREGLITRSEATSILKQAATSDCGKPNTRRPTLNSSPDPLPREPAQP